MDISELYSFERTFNPETLTVTTTRTWRGLEPEIETVTLKEFYARKFAFDHLHWHGRFARLIRPEHHEHCFTHLADGFGKGTPPPSYDWSHFRDSSPEACLAMADYIARTIWADCKEQGFDHLYNEILTWWTEHGINPLESI